MMSKSDESCVKDMYTLQSYNITDIYQNISMVIQLDHKPKLGYNNKSRFFISCCHKKNSAFI